MNAMLVFSHCHAADIAPHWSILDAVAMGKFDAYHRLYTYEGFSIRGDLILLPSNPLSILPGRYRMKYREHM